ncbi:MAG: hypothetical protein KAX49_02240 [Halanaerobiales bacterium]|nr:hypothetical protein [Halanaerobiales bacterium]
MKQKRSFVIGGLIVLSLLLFSLGVVAKSKDIGIQSLECVACGGYD